MEDDIAEDASCVPPRPEGHNEVHPAETQDLRNQHPDQLALDNNQGQNHANKEETCTTSSSVLSDVHTPHKDWKYNKLLVDLSDALKDEDLKIMKRMYKGEIGSGALEKITDAFSLFSSMEKRFDLSSINLLTLCALLYIAHRCDLIRKVAKYSKETENALYVDTPKRSAVNGYTYVEFHVAGRDFTKTTKKDLRDFTKNVATLLTVEERFVKLVGVDPSSSIKITILLREQDVTALQNVLEKKDSVDSKTRLFLLVFYGVDTVIIGDETFRIQEALSAPIEDDEQMQLDMHQQLHKYKHALEETELENQTLKNKVLELQAENDVWVHSVKPDRLSPDDGKGNGQDKNKQLLFPNDIKTALENFKVSLAKMSDAKYDKETVLELLQAHITLIASRCYHELSSIIVKSNMQLMNIFHDSVMAATHGEVHRFMGVSADNLVVRALKEISMKLTPEEKQTLQKEYQWTKDEKELADKDVIYFFVILLHKEHEKQGSGMVDLKAFLQKSLTKIDRLDLLQVFLEELGKPVVTGRKEQPTESQKTTENKNEGNEQTTDELMKNVKLLMEKVDRIDKNLSVMSRIPSVENMANIVGEYAKLSMFQQLSKEKFVV